MIGWHEPWYPVADEVTKAGLAQQLQQELAPGHVLSGIEVILIARRGDTDDALFLLPDGRVAEVHMTWRQSRETDPHWPATAVFPTLEQWSAESMMPTHRMFFDDKGQMRRIEED